MPHRAGHDSTPLGPPSSGSRRRYAPSPGEIKAITGNANAPGGISNIQEPQPQSQPYPPPPSDLERYRRPDPVDNSLKLSFQPDPYALVKAGNNNFDAFAGLGGAGFTTKNNPFRFTGGKGFGDNEDYLRLMFNTGLGETGINRLNANYDLLNNQGNLGLSVPVQNYNVISDQGTFFPGVLNVNSSVTGDGLGSPTFSYNQNFLPRDTSGFLQSADGGLSVSANQNPTFNLGAIVDPVGGIANFLGFDSSKIDSSLKPPLDVGLSYNLDDNSPQFNIGFGF